MTKHPTQRIYKLFYRLLGIFLLFSLFANQGNAQCYGSGWGTGIYYGSGINTCTQGSNTIASTQYQQWDGVAGYNYKFTISGGFAGSGAVCWTYFEVVGGSWTAMQKGLGATADVTAQNTSPAGNGWNLIVFYNDQGCPPAWPGTSATLTYVVTATQTPSISMPSNITVCASGPTAVSYSTPTSSNCNQGTYLFSGLGSGATFPVGTTPVIWNTNFPNGAGGYFSYPLGSTNQQIALAACNSVYGSGNCVANSCGNFTYYMSTSNPGCNCSTAQQQYEFIYSNTGYTQVGQDYGGGTDDVTGNNCFTRVKGDVGCSVPAAWRLAQKNLGGGGAQGTFNVSVLNPSVPALSGTTSICQGSTTTLSSPPIPTGGTVTSVGGFRIHSFTSTGTLTVPSGFNGYVDALVVGGGGGGGANMGGGGGGGGVVISPLNLTAGSYTATVGAGGAGAPAGTGGHPSVAATGGGNSSISSLTAIGGGRGGTSYNTYGLGINLGGSGGSGGGAEGYNNDAEAPGTQAGGAGTVGQGYRGGNQGTQYYSGGGGGAGGPGADGNNQANGGPGVACNYLGTNYYWGGGGGGAGYSICGGNGGIGGGGGGAVCTTTGGAGLNNGSGGGGGVTNAQTNTPGGNAGANTGGGGGGGSHYNFTNQGGNGGSGIVVVRYPDPTGGTWSSSNTGVATVNSSGVVTGVGAGTATITYSVSPSGCTKSVSTVVTVVANPTGGSIPTVNYCSSTGSATVSVTGVSNATQYAWSLPSGLTGSSTGSSISVSGATPGSYTVSVTPQDVAAGITCTGSQITGTVNIVATPSGGSISTVNYCSSAGSATVSVTGVSNATQYAWSLPSGLTGSSTSSSITVSGATAGTYTVTVTPQDVASGITCNSGSPITGTVNIVATPSGGSISTVNYCSSAGSATVSVTGVSNATQYAWSLPSGLTGSSTSSTITVSGATAGSYTVSVTAQDVASGITCTGSQITGTVNIVATPGGGSIAAVNFCSSTGSASVTVAGVSNATQYAWSLPSGLTGSSTSSSITVSGSTPNTYTVTVTPQDVSSGITCNGTQVTGTVTIYGPPTATQGGTTSANVCAATSATYTVPSGYGSTNGTILWTSSSTSGTPGSVTGGSTGYTPTYSFSANEIANGATITLTMTVTGTGGVCSTPATTTFTINAYGATSAIAGPTTSDNVCAATTPTYTVPAGYGSANGTVLWTSSSSSGSPGSITSGSTGYTPTYTFSTNEITSGATITLTMTVSNPGCANSTQTFTINAYGAATATAGGTTSANVCAATSSTYTVPLGYSSTNGTVLWTSSSTSGTPGGITGGSAGYTPTYSFSADEIANGATIILTMTVSGTGGYCSAPATTTFTINAYGATSATAGPTTSDIVCAATTPTYTVPAGYASTNGTVLWTSSSTSGSPGNITSGATGYTPTYTFSANEVANGATITLTMTVSNPGCANSTQTFTINAYGAPTSTAGGTTSAIVCAATSATYTVPSGYSSTNGTILWTSVSSSGTPGSITSGATGYTPTYTFSGDEVANGATITLTMTISNVAGCTNSTQTFTINAYGANVATAGPTTSDAVCSSTGSYAVPSGYSSANGTVLWTASSTSGSTGTISGGTGYTPTYTFSGADQSSDTAVTVTLTMTVSNPGCSDATSVFTLTINPTPAISSQSTTACSSQTFNYTPAGLIPSGTTYDWSAPTLGAGLSGSTGAQSGQSNLNDNLVNSTASAVTATYSVTPTAGSCTGAAFTVTVTVNPTPVIADQSTSSCSLLGFNYTPTGTIIPAGTTYAWSTPTLSVGLSGGLAASAQTDLNGLLTNVTTNSVTATYSVTPTAGSCSGAAFTVTVTVNPTPVLTGQSTSTCSAATFNYTPTGAVIPSGTTYAWSSPVGSGFSGSAGASSGTTLTDNLINSGSTAVTAVYSLTPTIGTCTGAAFDVSVTVDPVPSLSDQYTNACSDVAITYTPTGGTIPSGTTYAWNAPSGTGFTGGASGSGTDVTATLTNSSASAVTATYSVTPTSGSCTGAAFNVVVTLNPSPSAAVVSDNLDPCNGGHTAYVDVTGGSSPYSFLLTFTGSATASTQNYTGTVPAEFDAQGATSIDVSGIVDANGCPAASVTGSPVSYSGYALTPGNTQACTVPANSTRVFFDGSAKLMAKVTAGTTALGSTTVIATVDGSVQTFGPTNAQSYLQRHFQITPATNAAANVCLYISNAEVSALNVASLTDNHSAPSYYQTFSTILTNVNVTQYDGGAETPTSHTTSLTHVITGITATPNPVVDGANYNGVWELCFNVSGFSGFYIHANNVNNDPLPVTLISFTAKAVDNKFIQLDWATATEIDNSGFQIERSINGTDFQVIGWAQGHDNSTVVNNYRFSDLSALPGIIYYYRLKQVDFDGQYKYSNIASASLTGSPGFTLETLMPNPASSQVMVGVISNVDAATTIHITDMLGRVVIVDSWQMSVGYNTNKFDLESLAAGAYTVTIFSGDNRTSKRLIINR